MQNVRCDVCSVNGMPDAVQYASGVQDAHLATLHTPRGVKCEVRTRFSMRRGSRMHTSPLSTPSEVWSARLCSMQRAAWSITFSSPATRVATVPASMGFYGWVHMHACMHACNHVPPDMLPTADARTQPCCHAHSRRTY
eukprot:365203-Chlamydomonas_euryale.AAC.13